MVSCTCTTVLDLAVMGVVDAEPLPTRAIVTVVKELCGPLFTPTFDVVVGRINDLAAAGFLMPLDNQGIDSPLWRPTPTGRAHLARLLSERDANPATALGAVCTALKIGHAESLKPDDRAAIIEDLLSSHQQELRRARESLSGPGCNNRFVRCCLLYRLHRWQGELDRLKDLKVEGDRGGIGTLSLVERTQQSCFEIR